MTLRGSQTHLLPGRLRAKRYRDKKAGKPVEPSMRTIEADLVKEDAKRAGVSVRQVNRVMRRICLERERHEGESMLGEFIGKSRDYFETEKTLRRRFFGAAA